MRGRCFSNRADRQDKHNVFSLISGLYLVFFGKPVPTDVGLPFPLGQIEDELRWRGSRNYRLHKWPREFGNSRRGTKLRTNNSSRAPWRRANLYSPTPKLNPPPPAP